MKAFVVDKYRKKAPLRLADVPEPTLGGDEVLVQIHAAGVNLLDAKIRDGEFKPFLPYKLPLILGHDMAGTVVKTGPKATRYKVGDEVYSRVDDFRIGTFAERIAVKESSLAAKPRTLTMEEAASVPLVALTVWQALVEIAKLRAGQKVFIQAGSGGVGTIAIQLAKHIGAYVATTASAANADWLKALGADLVINYKEQPEWGDAVLAATGGRGADIVVEVGGPGTLPQSIRACAVGGHIALIGVLTGFAGAVPTVEMMRKQQTLKGLIVGSREQQQDMVRALENFGWKPVIDSRYPLEQMVAAFEHQAAGRHFGKICLEY